MVFSKKSTIISKQKLDKTSNLQIPTARRDDNIDVVLVYGKDIDIFDASENIVFPATSKDTTDDAVFILFYDTDGFLVSKDSNLQITGENMREVSVLADSSIYVAGIINKTQTSLVKFYNQKGQNQVTLQPPIENDTDMVFIAVYSYNTDNWLWSRTVQINNSTAGIIDSLNFLSLTKETLLLNVSAKDQLQLYNNGVKVVPPLDGSSSSNFIFIKNSGTLLINRGIYSTVNTSFIDSSKSTFGNLIAGSIFVEDTSGLFFQAQGSNQGIGLPAEHQSCVITLFNSVVEDSIYSLFFVGLDLEEGTYNSAKFFSNVNFLNNQSLYVNILCKKDGDNFKISTTGGSFEFDETILKTEDNGYLLLRFEIMTSQPRNIILRNLISFEGNNADISLNNNSLISRLGPILDQPNKPTGIAELTSTINLSIENVTKINFFDVKYKNTNNVSYIETNNIDTSPTKGVIWLEYNDQQFKTYYTSSKTDIFVGQSSSKFNPNSTISIVYNPDDSLVKTQAPFLEEDILNYSGTPLLALVTINNTGPDSPWKPWLVCIIAVALFSITLSIIYLLVNFYEPLQKKYGKKYDL